MTLEKVVSIDRIEIIENGSVQVRTKTAVIENGTQISCAFHRHVVTPGDNYSVEDPKVQAICATVHTPDVIAAYKLAQQEQIPA